MGILRDNLNYILNSSLKIEDLWPQFLDAVGMELETQKTDTNNGDDLTQYFNDIYNLPQDKLIDLCKKFGYTPNLILDSSKDFLIQEAELIPYRIRNKTTSKGYMISFKEINKLGIIFNFYYTSNKIIKSLNWEKTFSNLLNNNTSFSEPFTQIVALPMNDSLWSSKGFKLDNQQILDDADPWNLDNSIVKPTKYVGIEYILNNILDSTHLLTSDYFSYIDTASSYNRSSLNITSSGASFSILVSPDGSYNYFNPSNSYTIPSLQLKSAITHQLYSTKSLTNSFKVDASPEQTLDEAINWYLDGKQASSLDLEIVKYISFGSGIKNLPDNNIGLSCLNFSNYIFFYTLDDFDFSTTLKDYSTNSNYMNITGTTSKVSGYLGKTVNFNGSTSAIAHNNFTFTNTDMTLSLWLTINSSTGTSTVFELSTLYKITYEASISTLHFYFLSNLVYSQVIIEGSHYFIINEFDRTNNNLNILINNTSVYTQDISSSTLAGENTLTVGGTNFKGYIESLNLVSSLYSSEQKAYFYNNKLSIITHLNKEIYRVTLDESEKYDNLTWWGVQSYAPTNSINEEYAFTKLVDTLSYSGTCKNTGIVSKTFGISYTRKDSLGNSYSMKILDNGNGELSENDWITGSINYTTGVYSVTLSRTIDVLYQRINSESTNIISEKSLLDNNLKNTIGNVTPNSFKLFYLIGSASYTAYDNGEGTIVGSYVSSGTIDYTNGIINVQFSTSTKEKTSISCQFSYTNYPIIETGTIAYISYSLTNTLPITEVALENANKEVLAYATFPAIEASSKDNYFSPVFLMQL